MNENLDPFEDAFRTWAERPPQKSAAEAAREVVEIIKTRSRRRVLRYAALAAAAVVVAALSAVVLRTPSEPAPQPVVVAELIQPSGVNDGVVLMWLDVETKLYMVFQTSDDRDDTEGQT